MKKIVSIVALSLVCSFSFAQSSPETTSTVQEKTFISNKTKGEYNFQMPEGTSEQKITETANYYVAYFEVDYDAKTRIAHIKMVKPDAQGVIIRFLISNSIETISYNGKDYPLEKFIGDFVQ